jgi:hypothetical protein
VLNPEELQAAVRAAGSVTTAQEAFDDLHDLAVKSQNGHAEGRAADLKSLGLKLEEIGRELEKLYS